MVPNAHLATDELDLVGTLSVAITSSVLGHTTDCVHLNKIDSTIEATRKVGHVDIE